RGQGACGEVLMSGRILRFGTPVATMVVAWVLTSELLGSLPGVTARNVRRIEYGMTMNQVEKILGAVGKPYLPPRMGCAVDAPIVVETLDGSFVVHEIRTWEGEDGQAAVYFCGKRRVLFAAFSKTTHCNLLSRLRGWVGLEKDPKQP